ncbi:hypothetical protein LJC18_02265 [Lachnospiraceae bacterium OttesenSCG-928-E19]|nr:hypothetical protein [Lachnospiraceae bacterium OttesenSCG-928-E19]
MLKKIKNIWNECKFALVALALLVVYLTGKKRGKQDEKAQSDKAVLANISRADRARSRLNDSDFARRLREKYTRK